VTFLQGGPAFSQYYEPIKGLNQLLGESPQDLIVSGNAIPTPRGTLYSSTRCFSIELIVKAIISGSSEPEFALNLSEH
jgi:hypothetical protein